MSTSTVCVCLYSHSVRKEGFQARPAPSREWVSGVPLVTCAVPLQELSEMLYTDRPDWQSVMQYVAQIYKYFET